MKAVSSTAHLSGYCACKFDENTLNIYNVRIVLNMNVAALKLCTWVVEVLALIPLLFQFSLNIFLRLFSLFPFKSLFTGNTAYSEEIIGQSTHTLLLLSFLSRSTTILLMLLPL